MKGKSVSPAQLNGVKPLSVAGFAVHDPPGVLQSQSVLEHSFTLYTMYAVCLPAMPEAEVTFANELLLAIPYNYSAYISLVKFF